jgi:multisubunit Na+/H+ antiporter MnhF subunit
LAEAAVGALGVLFMLRGRSVGLVLIALYAVLGLAGLDHSTLAPISAHTLAMNATIWLETATAILLLGWIGAVLVARRSRAA